MLAYLLDENISGVVAAQVRAKRLGIAIASLHEWRGGALRAMADGLVIEAAGDAGLTLVTYDVKTIAPILVEMAQEGTAHSGVLFVDHLTIGSGDLGGLVRALIGHWDLHMCEDWTNRVDYLRFVR